MDLLDQMETFARVVETGSLSAAARARRLSLPAVSRQLRALEEDLGVPLIVRTTRRLLVTQAGRAWYQHSARILRDVEAARAVVTRGELQGTLTVSVSVTIGMHYLFPRLPALLKRHPGLSLEIRLEEQMVDLVAEGVDVAVRGGGILPDSHYMVAHPLRRFPRFVVAAPAYLRRHGAPRDPSALAHHECLTQVGPISTWSLRRGEEERSVNVTGRLRSTTPMALLHAAREGIGLALLPEWLVADDLEAGRLKRVLAQWESPPVTIWAVHRIELRGSPRVRAFLDGIR